MGQKLNRKEQYGGEGGSMSGVLVLGAGGHGKVVADILLAQGWTVMGFLDDTPATWNTSCLGLPVLGGIDTWESYGAMALVPGIGSNKGRRAIVERLGAAARPFWRSAVHPSAILSPSVTVGAGTVIAAGVVINPDVRLGDHVIVNTGATVDHDCQVAPYAHLAPGTHLAGGVTVGEGTLLGIGAVVIPARKIGRWSVVGAGAAVTSDIPDEVTAVGVPARWQ